MSRLSTKMFRVMILIAMLSLSLSACGGEATPSPTSGVGGTGTGTATTVMTGTTGEATATTVMTGTTGGLGTATTVMTSTTGGEATATTSTSGGATSTITTTTGATSTITTTGGTPGGTLSLPSTCSSVELAYWNPFTGPDGPFMQKLVDQFNSANPNIKVTMTSQSDYNTKLATAAASDTLPDVAVINEDQIATQSFNHIIRPIDSLVQQMGLSSSSFPAAAWTLDQVHGHTYGIPLSIVPMTMYYNADLFQKAGLSGPPKTADDFAKDAAALTNGATHVFMITSGFPITQIFQQLLHQYGGSEFNADASQATWNSDAGVKALQWMVDAQSKYSAPKLPVDADLNAFKAGQAGIIWNGIWQVTNVTGDAVDFKGMATSVPQIGTQPATWAGMANLSLPMHKKGEDTCKDAAAAVFIKYVLDNSATWAGAGNIPALNSVRNSPQLQAMQPQGAIAPSVENPVFPPPIPGVSDALGPLNDAVGAIMSGTSTDIKGTLDSAVTRANQILKQNHDNYGDDPATSHPATPTPAPTATPKS